MESALPDLKIRLRSAFTGLRVRSNDRPFDAANRGDYSAALRTKKTEHGHVFFPAALPS